MLPVTVMFFLTLSILIHKMLLIPQFVPLNTTIIAHKLLKGWSPDENPSACSYFPRGQRNSELKATCGCDEWELKSARRRATCRCENVCVWVQTGRKGNFALGRSLRPPHHCVQALFETHQSNAAACAPGCHWLCGKKANAQSDQWQTYFTFAI